MKCTICDSETPPLYRHVGALVCHTCRSLGKMIEGLVVESEPPVAQIEAPGAPEATQETTAPAETEPAEEDQTPPSTSKRKTAKLKA